MSKYLEWLDEANERQRYAILEKPGHCVVRAGPGTGKTRTLVLKAAKLLYDEIFPPRGLACVTYTQAMATELRQRLRDLGISKQQHVFIGTLHGFCLTYILLPFAKLFNYPLPDPIRIISEKEQADIYEQLWEQIAFKALLVGYEPEYRDGERADRLPISFQKYRRTHFDGPQSETANPYAENLLDQYETALQQRNCIDFDLQVKWSMQLVEREEYVQRALEAKFPWMLVDEYQDVGLPLHRMVKALTQKANIKLFAIGDTNQCIYGFSGANPDYLKELCSTTNIYGEHITLTKNYRSRGRILQAAEILASESIQLEPTREDGDGVVMVFETDRLLDILRTLTQQANIPPGEIMILHRWRRGCQEIIQKVQESDLNIPCFNASQELYDYRRPLLDWLGKVITYVLYEADNREIRFQDLYSFWQMLLISSGLSNYDSTSLKHRVTFFNALNTSNQYGHLASNWLEFVSDSLNLAHLLSSYKRKAPDEVEEFKKFKAALEPDGPLSNLSLQGIKDRVQRRNRVYIGTLHSSKGQENRTVIIADAENLNVGGNDVERQDENQRLFYVGVTRAKDQVYITQNRFAYLAHQLRQGLQELQLATSY